MLQAVRNHHRAGPCCPRNQAPQPRVPESVRTVKDGDIVAATTNPAHDCEPVSELGKLAPPIQRGEIVEKRVVDSVSSGFQSSAQATDGIWHPGLRLTADACTKENVHQVSSSGRRKWALGRDRRLEHSDQIFCVDLDGESLLNKA